MLPVTELQVTTVFFFTIFQKAQNLGFTRVDVKLKGPGPGRQVYIYMVIPLIVFLSVWQLLLA